MKRRQKKTDKEDKHADSNNDNDTGGGEGGRNVDAVSNELKLCSISVQDLPLQRKTVYYITHGEGGSMTLKNIREEPSELGNVWTLDITKDGRVAQVSNKSEEESHLKSSEESGCKMSIVNADVLEGKRNVTLGLGPRAQWATAKTSREIACLKDKEFVVVRETEEKGEDQNTSVVMISRNNSTAVDSSSGPLEKINQDLVSATTSKASGSNVKKLGAQMAESRTLIEPPPFKLLLPRPYFRNVVATTKLLPLPKDSISEMSEGRRKALARRETSVSNVEDYSIIQNTQATVIDSPKLQEEVTTLEAKQRSPEAPEPKRAPNQNLPFSITDSNGTNGINSVENGIQEEIPPSVNETEAENVILPPFAATTLSSVLFESTKPSSWKTKRWLMKINSSRSPDTVTEFSDGVGYSSLSDGTNGISSAVKEIVIRKSRRVRVPTVKRMESSVYVKDTVAKEKNNNSTKKSPSGTSVKVVDGRSTFLRDGKEVIVDADPKLRKENPNFDNNAPWICSFCHMEAFVLIPVPKNQGCKSPHAMGDLFGPYYANLPSINEKREVWFHGDCALWAKRLLMASSHILRLEEALLDADEETCIICGKTGATISCNQRNCKAGAGVHYTCAKFRGWKFNENTFLSYCPEHSDSYSCSS